MKKYSLKQLKNMSADSAQELAGKIRRFLVDHVTVTGGHLASNLGIVEISLALLRCFDLPGDKIIYDTGHQSYVHKLFTGRSEEFASLRQFGGISGFPRRSESCFDAFGAGHSSTSVSAAVGFAEAQKIASKDDPYYSVAVIGDGAFTGGMVFEALNNVTPNSKLIIILNDNEMSISPSVGALAEYLNCIRQGDNYYRVMEKGRMAVSSIPLVGEGLTRSIIGAKLKLKRMLYSQSNLFELYGIRYFGPADGNDLKTVERLIRVAKKQNAPCIIHLLTKKGKGYEPAELDPSSFHSVGAKKKPEKEEGRGQSKKSGENFSSVFGKIACELAEKEDKIVAMTAAMCDGVGLTEFAGRFHERFFDAGIAEEHALTCCAAMAVGGLLPIFAVYSTFFQRAYDQLLHDVALQNIKMITVLDRAGIVGEDGPTHHGLYDVSMTLNMPGVRIYSPACYGELRNALYELCAREESGEWKIPQPAVVRIPRGSEDPSVTAAFACEASVERYAPQGGEDCVILTYGRITAEALKAQKLLAERGIRAAVVKIARLKPLDEAAVETAVGKTRLLYILEEGMSRGGFGESLVSDCATGRRKIRADRMFIRGVEECFVPHGKLSLLLEYCGLSGEKAAAEIEGLLGKSEAESAGEDPYKIQTLPLEPEAEIIWGGQNP